MHAPLRLPRLLLAAALLLGLSPLAHAQTTLFDFEDGVQGWTAGENTAEVTTIMDKPINAAGDRLSAFEGQFMLDAVPVGGPAPQSNDWRAVERTFDPALDLSAEPLLKVAFSSFGYGASSRLHEARITVFSGDDSEQETYEGIKDEADTFVNAWDVLELDLSEFDGNDSITRILIEFRNNDDGEDGTPAPGPWGGKFQLDFITAEATDVAAEDAVPGLGALSRAYPNPTATRAALDLTVTETQRVAATVYDLLGRTVARVYDDVVAAGAPATIAVEAADLTPGLYLVRVEGATFSETRRLVVAR